MLVSYLAVFGLFLIAVYFLSRGHESKNLPPGPKGLPLLGSLLSVTKKPYLKFGTWVKDYGKIFSVRLAKYRIVVVSDPQLVKEAFNNSALIGNPDFALMKILFGKGHGITGSDGKTWAEQRRFTLRSLKEFGFGKKGVQDLYMDEVMELITWLNTVEGKSVSLNRRFVFTAINALWMIMTGKKFKHDDEQFRDLTTNVTKLFYEMFQYPLILISPSLAQKLPKFSGWGKLIKYRDDLYSALAQPVNEHMKQFSQNESPRDFIDSYIQEIRETKDPKSSFYKDEGVKNLKTVVRDLFGAGTETTGQTLSFAILFLTKFPEIQRLLQKEIDQVVGSARPVTLEDKKSMPYAEAVVLETLRKSIIAPYGIIHEAMETTSLAGYTIPKGTWIIANLHYIHHDPKVWGDPDVFRPERFLSADGSTVVKNDSFMPFSAGKRICLGESLAKDGIFLILTNFFQKFSTVFDPSKPEPGLEGVTALFRACEIYSVILSGRS